MAQLSVSFRVDSNRSKVLQKNLLKKSLLSELMTDEYHAYNALGSELKHHVINHQVQFAEGDKHTNTIEGFWSLCFSCNFKGVFALKRYQMVSFCMFSYWVKNPVSIRVQRRFLCEFTF